MRPLLVIVSPWYPSSVDPALGSFVAAQAGVLSDLYDIVVIAPVLQPWRRALVRRRRVGTIEGQGTVRIVRPWVRPRRPFSLDARYRAYEGVLDSSWRAIGDERRPLVVHAHVVLPTGPAAVSLARSLGCPIVLTEHSNPFAMHLARPHDRALTQRVLHDADRVIAVSPGLRDEIVAFAPEVRVTVVGNAIDTDRFTPGAGPPEPRGGRPLRLLSVGLMTADKGMARVVRAAAVVAASSPVELVLVGDGPQRAKLARLVADVGLAGSSRMPGLLDPMSIRDWMRWSDVFVLGSQRETFGVVLAEAMATGTPVAATPTAGARFVIEPGDGILADSFDDRALAAAITRVANGEHAGPEVIRAGIIRRFGGGAFRSAISAIYKEVANRPAGDASSGQRPHPSVDR